MRDRLIGLTLILAVLHTAGSAAAAQQIGWFRGNTHSHTDQTDGNAPPTEVAEYYRDLGYDFVVLSDHDILTPVADLQRRVAPGGTFLLIPGEEVSANHDGRAVHLNGIGIGQAIKPLDGDTVADVIRNNQTAIHAAGGIAHLNHPNYGWFMTADDIAAATITHLEIMNAHPVNNSFGGGGWPAAETTWDDLLTRGMRVFGVASDDAHDYDPTAARASDRGPLADATPGKAWIVVRSAELTADAIVHAIAHGDFYASTGVEFEELTMGPDGIAFRLPTGHRYHVPVPGKLRYRTEFVGANGEVLAVDESNSPGYRLRENDLYVRARVIASDGSQAWTQPVFGTDGGFP